MSLKSPGTGGLSAGAGGSLALGFTNTSGTPGAATINTPRGRCAIAAAAASVVITSSVTTANSTVLAMINQAATDTTLTSIIRVQTASGSFTITGNAASTAAVTVDFVVFN